MTRAVTGRLAAEALLARMDKLPPIPWALALSDALVLASDLRQDEWTHNFQQVFSDALSREEKEDE